MAGNLNLQMQLTANASQLTAELNRADGKVRSFSSSATSYARKMTASFKQAYAQLNGFSTVSKLVFAAGGISLLRDTMQRNLEFEKTLLDMKQTAEMTVQQAAELRRLAIDAASDSLATPTEMAAGLQKLAAYGVKFESIRDMILESARAAVAFRSTVEQMATLDFNLQDKMGIKPSQMKDAHNMLLYHAKSGNFDGAAMVNEAPKYLNSAASVGITGVGGLNLMGAITQVLMKYAPDTQKAEVSTLAGQGLGHLTTSHFYKKLEKNFGIDIKQYMPDGKFYGEGGAAGFLALAREMKRKGLENPFNLDKAGVRDDYFKKFMLGVMKYADQMEAATKAANERAQSDAVGADKAEIMKSNYGKAKKAQIAKEKAMVGDTATTGVDAFARMQEYAADHTGEALSGAAGLGALYLANRYNRNGKARTAASKAAAAASGAAAKDAGLRVFVTNWPAGMLSAQEALKQKQKGKDGVVLSDGASPDGKPQGKWGKVARGAGKALGVAGAAVSGLELGYNVIGPVVNELINSLTSAIVGRDETLGGAIYDLLHKKEETAAAQNAQLTTALERLAQRPVEVQIDGHAVAAAVNGVNGRDARRQ